VRGARPAARCKETKEQQRRLLCVNSLRARVSVGARALARAGGLCRRGASRVPDAPPHTPPPPTPPTPPHTPTPARCLRLTHHHRCCLHTAAAAAATRTRCTQLAVVCARRGGQRQPAAQREPRDAAGAPGWRMCAWCGARVCACVSGAVACARPPHAATLQQHSHTHTHTHTRARTATHTHSHTHNVHV
jgi:hypothetical protein